MKRMNSLACAFALACSTLAPMALAANQGAVGVTDPWTRPTPPGTPMGVGYMKISNHTDEDVRLVGAQTPKAGHVSIHETVMDGDIMRMQTVKGGLAIPAGETVKLKPMSYHLMLEQLNSPITEGEPVPVTLEFEGAGPMDVELRVQPMDGGMTMDHSKMEH
ncbi:MAG: copper chaperone PCu(A)C [Alteromonadaceae bacterium]|nr:copper chaperone PCu(A)C [Alteromonadaceae bacterium]